MWTFPLILTALSFKTFRLFQKSFPKNLGSYPDCVNIAQTIESKVRTVFSEKTFSEGRKGLLPRVQYFDLLSNFNAMHAPPLSE